MASPAVFWRGSLLYTELDTGKDKERKGKYGMWTILFIILFFMVFGQLLGFSLKAAWGLTKVLLVLVILPVMLIFLVIKGLLAIAFPLLAVVGLITLVKEFGKLR